MILDTASVIFTLGPQGTFSDEAAHKAFPSPPKVHYTRTFQEALRLTTQTPESVCVVPVENSVAGTIASVQDSLVAENLTVLQEVIVPVQYSLFLQGALDLAGECFAHPQAFEQTSQFLSEHLPQARCIFSDSNIDSGVRFLKQAQDPNFAGAAVVPSSFGRQHPQWVRFEDIQDYANNTTRFLVVRRRQESEHFDFSKQKTSLFVEFQEDRPGLLYEMLSIFNRYGVNLCRLESRPSKSIPWAYVFYVDFYNHPEVEACLEALGQAWFRLRVLGSYDRIS